MKILLAAFAFCGLLHAQSVSLTATPASVPQGGSTSIGISFTAGTTPVGDVQWQSPLVPGATYGAWAQGSSLTAAAKQMQCFTPTGGAATCEASGMNSNPLAAGVIATAPLAISATAPVGPMTVALAGVVAADGNGGRVTLAVNPVTVTVTAKISKYDLNGDGVVDSKDLFGTGGYQQQIIGMVPCTTADVNGDGKCDVFDIDAMLIALRTGTL